MFPIFLTLNYKYLVNRDNAKQLTDICNRVNDNHAVTGVTGRIICPSMEN